MLIYLKNIEQLANYEAASKINSTDLNNLFEPFIGRLSYHSYLKIFNFEKNIYEDKQFKYSTISNFNKRIMPELMSGIMSNLIYNEAIDLEIRPAIENYMIAIMSNLDYINLADLEMVKNYKIDNKCKNLLYVMGTCPTIFSNMEREFTIYERLKTASLIKDGFVNKSKLLVKKIILRHGEEFLWKKFQKQHGEIIKNFNNPTYTLSEAEGAVKLTYKNLYEILQSSSGDLVGSENFNLIIVCSTSQILKLAIELEKLYYGENNFSKPSLILLVGTQNLYSLISNKNYLKGHLNDKIQNHFSKNEDFMHIYNIKNLQSFLFELFLHALDKNKF